MFGEWSSDQTGHFGFQGVSPNQHRKLQKSSTPRGSPHVQNPLGCTYSRLYVEGLGWQGPAINLLFSPGILQVHTTLTHIYFSHLRVKCPHLSPQKQFIIQKPDCVICVITYSCSSSRWPSICFVKNRSTPRHRLSHREAFQVPGKKHTNRPGDEKNSVKLRSWWKIAVCRVAWYVL